jgi:aldehyde:ferredoxin oxidoreductase
MSQGYAGSFLEIDLSSRRCEVRDTTPYIQQYIGGRGIATRLAWEQIPAGTDAYDPENRLIVFTGPLTGTIAPTSGRTIFMSVSPRVYPRTWVTHSTMGGWFAGNLKFAGFDGLVVSGQADSPVYLSIEDGKAEIREAGDLWGLGTFETQFRLKERHGCGAQVICIGPAGENLLRSAIIQHDLENAAGRSGLGAVMGAKLLKAIVAHGTRGVEIAQPEELLREMAITREKALISPVDAFYSFSKSGGTTRDTPKQAKKRPVCSQSCTVNCHLCRVYHLEGLPDDVTTCDGNLYTLGVEGFDYNSYEGGGVKIPGVRPFGEANGVRVHRMVGDLGLDLSVLLTVQPWLFKCMEMGYDNIRGEKLDPANPDWFMHMMQEMVYRKGIGGIFSEGLSRAADELKGEFPQELIDALRILEFAFGFMTHRDGRIGDLEPLPYWAVSALMYASSSRDACIGTHTAYMQLANVTLNDGDVSRQKLRRLSKILWGSEEGFEPNYECVAPVAIWAQHQHIIMDSLPLCEMAFPRTIGGFHNEEEWWASPDPQTDLEIGARLLNACTGTAYTNHDLEQAAERVFNLERAMLAEWGRDRKLDETVEPQFELPCSSDGTKLDKARFDQLLDEYYQLRGWDLEHGWPERETLEGLGLEDVANRLGL